MLDSKLLIFIKNVHLKGWFLPLKKCQQQPNQSLFGKNEKYLIKDGKCYERSFNRMVSCSLQHCPHFKWIFKTHSGLILHNY
jgi:hypothetical protein